MEVMQTEPAAVGVAGQVGAAGVAVLGRRVEAEDPFEIIAQHVSRYLHLKDLKNLRLLNSVFNMVVNKHPSFVRSCVGTISTKFYSFARGANRNNRIEFEYFKLNHFAYYRNEDIFKLFWQEVGQTITSLTLSNSSFECDGLAFILNHLPKLNSLTLTGVKLRDLDNLHRPDVANIQVTENIHEPLKHLTFDNMNYVENCMMEYLVNRTSALESFTLTSCFLPRTTNAYVYRQIAPNKPPLQADGEVVNAEMGNDSVEETKLIALYEQFKFYLRQLLARNAAHLKKIVFANNFRPADLIPIYSSTLNMNLAELNLDVRQDERPGAVFGMNQYDTMHCIIHLITTSGTRLEKLSLDFFKPFNNAELTALLAPPVATLKELQIKYDHTNLRLAAVGEVLNLEGIQHMVQLEKFELTDKARVVRDDLKKLASRMDMVKTEITGRIASRVNTDFILVLPNVCTSLKLDGIQSRFNYLNPVDPRQKAQLLTSLQSLSTLEIKGPWTHPIGPILQTIFQHLRQLNELSLVNCGIKDTHLTGLSHDTARELRKSNVLLLPVQLGNIPGGHPFPFMNPVVANGVPVPSLGDMGELKHLDLSENSGVTIVTIGYTLSRLSGLKSLGLASCHNINDSGLTLIGHYLSNLEELNVKHIRRVSQVGLNSVITACKRIRRLHVSKKVSNPARRAAGALNGGIHLLKAHGYMRIPFNPHYDEVVVPSDEVDPMGDEPSDNEEEN